MDAQSIKLEYFLTQLQKGAKDVFARQAQAAQSNIYSNGNDQEEGRSGILREYLESPKYSIATAGSGLQLIATLPEYGRFVDMKAHGNRAVYNQHLFGQLYRETLQDIKYEFRDWVKKNYGDSLRDLLNKT
ncbi:MAG: hypothetical protein J1E95_08640 [Muribaculaceae bacterium]|nr:hypothetical protein [Muribaculaceae bacterium]